jgi:hypothetical protein
MSEPLPDLPDLCWPVDWSVAPTEWVENPDNLPAMALAGALATSALRALTAYQVGGCPIAVRPCAKSCLDREAYAIYPVTGAPGVGPFQNSAGQWINGCGCYNDCSCTTLSEVILPGPVGSIVSVTVDGEALDSDAYRVDNGVRLVRTDGDTWPLCQDMTAAADEDGSFVVTYLNGIPVDGLASYAAGLLAYEFTKAMSGQNCGLPRGVTQVARAGITLELEPGSFPDGLTGVFAVDAWVRSVNPYSIKVPAAVFSVDRRRTRQTTFGGF